MDMILNTIYNEDCLHPEKGLSIIPDKSVDMVFCDLPYGTTACAWDTIIPFAPLWAQYERIIKDNGVIVLTASQPFTAALIMSNPRLFKYEWVWEKQRATGFLDCKNKPLKSHESVLVFYKKLPVYNPQFIAGKPYNKGFRRSNADKTQGQVYGKFNGSKIINETGDRYPRSVIYFQTEQGLHPTQKPVPLVRYFVKTYTNEGAVVVDNCMGSGTTAIACIDTNRNYIGWEKDQKEHSTATNRVIERIKTQELFHH